MRKSGLVFFTVILMVILANAQLAGDTILFSIKLIDDSTRENLYSLRGSGKICRSLSGPVVVKDDNLLFYSEHGYVLYNQKGTVLHSHSLFKRNKDLPEDSPKRIRLAFPLDPVTILYYQNTPFEKYPLTIFEKKLLKSRSRALNINLYPYLKEAATKQVFNLAYNTITDDMVSRCHVAPQMVGFSSLTEGRKWWSLDKFYSFLSPVIQCENSSFRSFFPGIKLGNNKKKLQFIEPLQVFQNRGYLYYAGIFSRVGPTEPRYYQTYFVFDQAGNILHGDTLLKQTNEDAIIGEDEVTYYTVKKMERFVFQPSINNRGVLFYGILDYKKKEIVVRKRTYYEYKPMATQPNLAHLIDNEKCVEFVPVNIPSNLKQPSGKTIPKITLLDSKNRLVRAQARHLTKKGFICRIFRVPNRDIEKKLQRKMSDLPKAVSSIMDSLSEIAKIACPYGISLSGPRGIIRSFLFPANDQVLCARVLAVQKSGMIIVRVDCDNYAEILLFKPNGRFINRFVFNRQNYKDRKDIVVAAEESAIIELDFESKGSKEKYYAWERRVVH